MSLKKSSLLQVITGAEIRSGITSIQPTQLRGELQRQIQGTCFYFRMVTTFCAVRVLNNEIIGMNMFPQSFRNFPQPQLLPCLISNKSGEELLMLAQPLSAGALILSLAWFLKRTGRTMYCDCKKGLACYD